MNAYELSREEVACPLTVEELLQHLEEERRKHAAERQMLIPEPTEAKQEVEDLNNNHKKKLQKEKFLRVQAETNKLEAVEIG